MEVATAHSAHFHMLALGRLTAAVQRGNSLYRTGSSFVVFRSVLSRAVSLQSVVFVLLDCDSQDLKATDGETQTNRRNPCFLFTDSHSAFLCAERCPGYEDVQRLRGSGSSLLYCGLLRITSVLKVVAYDK